MVPNDYVAAYVSTHREKLIGFASVDPRDADAPVELRSAVSSLGLEGLKLGPSTSTSTLSVSVPSRSTRGGGAGSPSSGTKARHSYATPLSSGRGP